MSQPPRNFQEWMRGVERTLNEVKRSSQASVSARIGREVLKLESEIAGVVDQRTPAAPIELVVQAYVVPDLAGTMHGYISLDFPDVVVATDATPLSIIGYEMWGRRIDDVLPDADLPPMRRVATATASSLVWEQVTPGATYEVAARALGANTIRNGLMSEPKTITVLRDLIPPPIPSALTATQHLSAVTLTWDGKPSGVNEEMPTDFSYTEYRLRLPNSTFIEPGDQLFKAGNFYDANAPYNAMVYYSHRAVDTSGNKSGWSIEVGISVTPLVDEQSIREALEAASTRLDEAAADMALSAEELSGRLDTAQTDLAASTERLTTAEGTVANLKDTVLPTLTSDLAAAEAILTPLPGKITATEAALAVEKGRLDTLANTTMPALNTEITAAKERLATTEATLAPLPAKVATAQSDLTNAFGQLGTVDSRVATAKAAAIDAAALTAQNKADAAEQAAIDAAALVAQAKVDTAKAATLTAAATTAQQKADQAEADAVAAAKTATDLAASGAKQEAIDAAAIVAQQKATAAQTAAINAAATAADSKVATAKAATLTEAAATAQTKATQALTDAKADATTKANKALADAKADAVIKVEAAKQAAITAAAADAKAQAEAAEARAATTAAADAKTKADAAQAAAILAAQNYADTEASGAGADALAAAKLDATQKADAAKVAAIEAAATDATAKQELAESNAANDAKTKADKALADAKLDATAKSAAAQTAAINAAAITAQNKADAAEQAAIDAAALVAQSKVDVAKAATLTAAATTAQQKADAAKTDAVAAAKTATDLAAAGAKQEAIDAAAIVAQQKATAAQTAAVNAAALTAQAKADTAKSEAISAAATTAQTKANQALADAKLDATTKANQALADAKLDATTKADAVKLVADAALVDAAKAQADALSAAGLAGTKGKVWIQPEAPGAEVTYGFAGGPNTSHNIKYADGIEVRRNTANNPSFESGSTAGWSLSGTAGGSGISTEWSRTGKFSVKGIGGGGNSGDIRVGGSAANTFPAGMEPGKTYTVSAYTHVPSGLVLNNRSRRVMFFYSKNSSSYTEAFGPQGTAEPGTERVSHTFTVPSDATGVVLGIGVSSGRAGDVTFVDDILIEEVGALDEFFYGGTPDDRQYDLWIDTDDGNKTRRWDGATESWIVFEDKRITDAADAAVAADAKAVEAKDAADQAIADALFASNVAAGKGTTYLQETAPTDIGPYDLWINPKEGNKHYKGVSHQAVSMDFESGLTFPVMDPGAWTISTTAYAGTKAALRTANSTFGNTAGDYVYPRDPAIIYTAWVRVQQQSINMAGVSILNDGTTGGSKGYTVVIDARRESQGLQIRRGNTLTVSKNAIPTENAPVAGVWYRLEAFADATKVTARVYNTVGTQLAEAILVDSYYKEGLAGILGYNAVLVDDFSVAVPPAQWVEVTDQAIIAAAEAAQEAKDAVVQALDDAKADATIKADAAEKAAKDAAALVADSKIATAKTATLIAAADAAQQKANTAKSEAIAAAETYADFEISGASTATLQTAKEDATFKANAAEKAATDAAALTADSKIATAKTNILIEAANAASGLADDAQAEAIRVAGLDATTKAGQAKTDAEAAATLMTNGIGKNLASTLAPTTGNLAPKGSVWRRTGANNTVIGVWEQTATGVAGTWTPRLITSEVVDNIDIGKLSASTAVINSAVLSKMAVGVATIIELNADRITAGTIDVNLLNAVDVAAKVATVIKLNADAINAGTIDTARLNVTTLSAAVANVIKLNASAINAGTIDTARLNVTTLSASLATVIKLNASAINTGTLDTARLNATTIAAATATIQTVDVKNLFATAGTFQTAVVDKFWAEVITAKKVTADMVLISEGSNLVVDPYSKNATLSSFRAADASVPGHGGGDWAWEGTYFKTRAVLTNSTLTFRLRPSPTQLGVSEAAADDIPVTKGASYKFRWEAFRDTGLGVVTQAAVYQRFDDGTWNLAVIGDSRDQAVATWTQHEATYVPASNVVSFGLAVQIKEAAVSGFIGLRGFNIILMSDASLIVNGGILAKHITASEELTAKVATFLTVTTGMLSSNAVTADKIDAGSVTTVKLDSGAVTADKINVGSLQAAIITSDVFTGKTFTGGTFTGSIFQTRTLASTGIKFDSDGIKAWDHDGNLSVSITNDGVARFVGRVASGPYTTPGATILPPDEHPAGYSGYWLTKMAGVMGGVETAGMWLVTPTQATAPELLNLRGLNNGGVKLWHGMETTSAKVDRVDGTNGGFRIWEATGSYFDYSILFKGTSEMTGRLLLKNTPSTTIAANAHIASANGTVYISSSAARFKIDPQPMELPDSLLEVPVKDWIDRNEMENYAELMASPRPHSEEVTREIALAHLERVPGVIAEEVEAAGGRKFVSYNADGLIQSVSYDRLAVAQVAILNRKLKAEQERGDRLEAALEELLGRVSALENA